MQYDDMIYSNCIYSCFYLAKFKVNSIILFPLIFEGVDFTGVVNSTIWEPLNLDGL